MYTSTRPFIFFALLTLIALGGCGVGGSMTANAGVPGNPAWTGDVTFDPAPANTIALAYGINDEVAELPSGDLPLTIMRTLTNASSVDMSEPVLVEFQVVAWNFVSVAGVPSYVEGPLDTHTIVVCQQQIAPLAAGESTDVMFTLGDAGCMPAVASLAPGMYRSTLTIDPLDDLQENHLDNIEHDFFFVQDTTQILLSITKNPDGDPDVMISGSRVVVPAFLGAKTVRTHQVNISTNPPTAGFTVNGRNMTGPLAGDVGRLTPIMPVMNAGVVSYTTTVNPDYIDGPCNAGPYYYEGLDTKITVISLSGTRIRQETLHVSVAHECNP